VFLFHKQVSLYREQKGTKLHTVHNELRGCKAEASYNAPGDINMALGCGVNDAMLLWLLDRHRHSIGARPITAAEVKSSREKRESADTPTEINIARASVRLKRRERK
jgi:hypothetical protein